MIKLTFLGTSSMVPTQDRNHTAILLSHNNEKILIDCGEGTQRQLRIAGISPAKITRILITHWHGDHILGLPGLLQTMRASNYQGTLKIYGPVHSKKYLENILNTYLHNRTIQIEMHEIKAASTFIKEKDFSVSASYLNHSAPCLGYSFKEADRRNINIAYTKKFGLTQHPIMKQLQSGKSIVFNGKKIDVKKATILKPGKKVTIILDTGMHANCIRLAKDSDMLVCESTYSKEHEQEAKEYKHLTSEQAALIAKKSKSKELILTHFSQRYKHLEELEKQAKEIFKNTKAAKDFASFEL